MDNLIENQGAGTENTEVYTAPSIEVIEVVVEQGFELSGPGGGDDGPSW